MTDALPLKPDLGRFGVWISLVGPAMGQLSPEQAVEIERLGYGAVWVGGSTSADLSFVEPILAQTESLTVATGVVNIWWSAAKPVAESYHRIEQAYPGRFVLGVGAGHPEHVEEYRKPYDALVEYLDELDRYAVPTSRRVVAALGDGVLGLAARRSAGAHPYLITPEHTAHAREVMGNTVFLAPEHKVVLCSDVEQARAIGRKTVELYLELSNYVNNWKRLGFTDADVLSEHLEAGADHVAIQALGDWDQLLPTLTELAGALGLTSRP